MMTVIYHGGLCVLSKDQCMLQKERGALVNPMSSFSVGQYSITQQRSMYAEDTEVIRVCYTAQHNLS